MEDQEILVTNIQRFSLHDGPGLRTTVFLKGCNAKCPWCCNPENISKEVQSVADGHNETTYGKFYSTSELFQILMKDKNFYEGGGVTFSGGEPLLQARQLKPLLYMLKEQDIHLAVETSLFCSEEQVKCALEYFDLFYVDMKIADDKTSKNTTGIIFQQYIKNLKLVLASASEVVIRIPFIPDYTDGENIDNIILVLNKLNLNNVSSIEVLKGHQLGKQKYKKVFGKFNNFYASKLEIKEDELYKTADYLRKSVHFSGEVKVNNL